MSNSPCGVVQMVSKVRCDLDKGHAASHMHFGRNGTTIWGFSYAQASKEATA